MFCKTHDDKHPVKVIATRGPNSKYKGSYPKLLREFFTFDPYREIIETYHYKDGSSKDSIRLIGADMRFIHEFAYKIGTNEPTLYNWAKEYPEFAEAMEYASKAQLKTMVINALLGNYHATFSIFAAKNMIGWRDIKDQRIEKRTYIGAILAKIETENQAGRTVYIGNATKPAEPARLEANMGKILQELGVNQKA